MKVLHLDHSTARGGAEYALLRMLVCPPPWTAALLLPRKAKATLGVFEPLRDHDFVRVRTRGPAQYSGASSKSLVGLVSFALRAIAQSVAIRLSPEFRSAEVIHTNTSRSAVYGALACFGSQKKLVVHLRDLTNEQSLGGVGLRLFARVALARADGVIANSQATLNSSEPYRAASTLTAVIPSAAGIGRSLNPPVGEVRRIGMVARLDPWKGQDLLIRAFAAECGGGPIRLVLAGDAAFGHEPYERHIRELAQNLGVRSQVDFLGHVDDVTELIDTFDLCVQASLRPEPLGQNILQYLAGGRPTIATDAGGPAEWIRSGINGVLFAMGDLDSLRSALSSLIGDVKLRERISQAAAETPGLLSDLETAELHSHFFSRVHTTPA